MTEHTNAELIAEARERLTALGMAANPVSLTFCLAEALEAADQRAVQAEAELRDAFRTDIPSLKDQRDALAAVVEKVREVLEPDERKLGRTSQTALEEVRSALAPANDERSSHDPEARG